MEYFQLDCDLSNRALQYKLRRLRLCHNGYLYPVLRSVRFVLVVSGCVLFTVGVFFPMDAFALVRFFRVFGAGFRTTFDLDCFLGWVADSAGLVSSVMSSK